MGKKKRKLLAVFRKEHCKGDFEWFALTDGEEYQVLHMYFTYKELFGKQDCLLIEDDKGHTLSCPRHWFDITEVNYEKPPKKQLKKLIIYSPPLSGRNI